MNFSYSEPPARGPAVEVFIHFKGLAFTDAGTGSWGAVIVFKESSAPLQKVSIYGRLGYSTSNSAEYMALIKSLRRTVRIFREKQMRVDCVKVAAEGDSQLVIGQMNGKMDVDDEYRVYYEVAKGVESKFFQLNYTHVPPCQNTEAAVLAQEGREEAFGEEMTSVYDPNRLGFIDVSLNSRGMKATFDLVTSGFDPSFFVDAQTLYNTNSRMSLLRNVEDSYPLLIVQNCVEMNVLGTCQVCLNVFPKERNNVFVSIIVVDRFPVPVHFSVRHPAMMNIDDRACMELQYAQRAYGNGFEACNLPARFASHPFWSRVKEGDSVCRGIRSYRI